MSRIRSHTIIALKQFIQAARDAGYKSITSALAELVDNSFEADAQRVDIDFNKSDTGEIKVFVRDDGCGMEPSALRVALQFGGSTRFNSRRGTGRYGMGLPNSSLSQARRVDVFTWRKKKRIWWSYLDIDEIVDGAFTEVPKPKRYPSSLVVNGQDSVTGTVVVWSKCDRVEYKYERNFLAKLGRTIGRLFRQHLWQGKRIYLCGEPVRPVDPLFMRKGNNLVGATPFGPPLHYEVEALRSEATKGRALIRVNFVELPIEDWHSLSNTEKRAHGISKKAGVSVVRAGREIDQGWFFMGQKRKENYDDWWRCEISFEPTLDELFGVTNTKQGIRPTETLLNILTPDVERVAHELNSRVRRRYSAVRANHTLSGGQLQASSKDYLLEPPAVIFDIREIGSDRVIFSRAMATSRKLPVPGLHYRIEHRRMDELCFFTPLLARRELIVQLNEDHPFYECVYCPFVQSSNPSIKGLYKILELVILAAARAEFSLPPTDSQNLIKRMREEWGKALATFLE